MKQYKKLLKKYRINSEAYFPFEDLWKVHSAHNISLRKSAGKKNIIINQLKDSKGELIQDIKLIRYENKILINSLNNHIRTLDEYRLINNDLIRENTNIKQILKLIRDARNPREDNNNH